MYTLKAPFRFCHHVNSLSPWVFFLRPCARSSVWCQQSTLPCNNSFYPLPLNQSSHKATLKCSCIIHIENQKLKLNVTKNFSVDRNNVLELNESLDLWEILCQTEPICTRAFKDASCVKISTNSDDRTLTDWWTETLLNQIYLECGVWIKARECLEKFKIVGEKWCGLYPGCQGGATQHH